MRIICFIGCCRVGNNRKIHRFLAELKQEKNIHFFRSVWIRKNILLIKSFDVCAMNDIL